VIGGHQKTFLVIEIMTRRFQMDAETVLEHGARGAEWLVERQESDGSWAGLTDPRIDGFYKASWALAETGHTDAAHRVLDYVNREFLLSNGDLGPHEHPAFGEIHHLYPNAYVIVGSARCGRYEVSGPTTRFLLTRQHPGTGGFYSQRGVPGQESRTDTMSTSAAGMACLATGELDAARRAGEYLEDMAEAQPDTGAGFYFTTKPDGELRRTFEDEDDEWWAVVRTDESDQCWYAVGLPFAFLLQLAAATGEERYHALADWYFEFQQSCVNPWSGGSSGKAAWATSMLYRRTGEERYREIALRIAEDVMIDDQNPDGSWGQGGEDGYAEVETDSLENSDFDITAEYTLWLALVGSNLAGRSRS
jgi:hypothetical protein